MSLDLDVILAGYRREWPPTLNTTQVAAMLGVSVDAVQANVSTRGLPAYRWGKNFRFFRDEVVEWLREQDARGATDPSA